MDTIKEIIMSYYFWLAVEALIIAGLLVFVRRFSGLKKSRTAEIRSRMESGRFSRLDEQIMNKRGRN